MGFEGSDDGPYDWQLRVAVEGLPEVLPIPTGLGKTEGAVLAWAWRKLEAGLDEPLHVVYCLPMRTLVRQTVERLDRCFAALAAKRGIARVPVFPLMAGAMDEEWVRVPDQPWVLVGTQDQLLSRALNRGYAMSRFDWPTHFGLLNNDCQWIVDEVQLMGPGLWTTSQLDWMRRKRFPVLKPCRTTWMSATVGTGFLATTDRRKVGLDKVEPFDPKLDDDKSEELRRRRSARRPVESLKPSSGKRAPSIYQQVASRVDAEHCEGTLSLVVCNTVNGAQELFKALPDRVPKIPVTSRFRSADRRDSEQQLTAFEARRSKSQTGRLDDDPGLICVSTQVVEAGIDISAYRLWSELAPWPSVVQRLGRLNRDGRYNGDEHGGGDCARAFFWQTPKGDEQKRDGEVWIGPYRKRDLDTSQTLIDAIAPLSQEMPFEDAIGAMDAEHRKLLRRALEPEPAPLPRALDVHGLFSAERDLHGRFTDVSAFVRNSDPDADLTVFWRVWQGGRPPVGERLDGPPFDSDSEGCPVAFHRLRELLAKQRAKAWIWDDEDELWETCAPDDLRPGMIVMLHRDVGGYSTRLGWTGDRGDVLPAVPIAGPGRTLAGDERTEIGAYVTIEAHLNDARAEATRICDVLNLSGTLRVAVVEAAAFHDLGKGHLKWQSALPAGLAAHGGPWAKCPRVLALDVACADQAFGQAVTALRADAVALPATTTRRGGLRLRWVVGQKLNRKELESLSGLPKVRWAGHVPFRPGMRHEAASALAMWKHYREGGASYPALAVYLAAAHHGKVRTVLRSTVPNGGEDIFGIPPQPDSLMVNGQCWPLDFSIAADGAAGDWVEGSFALVNYGWTGLIADLLGPWRSPDEDRTTVGAVPEGEPCRLGPFALAWLEALIRVADWRASANPSKTFTLAEVLRGQ